MTAPQHVQDLASQREQARADKDYGASDALREQIAGFGWGVKDTPAGQELAPLPPYPVLASVKDLPDLSGEPDSRRCTVALLVEGWPDDLRTCVGALLEHAPQDVVVVLLENGETDAGPLVHELAQTHERVEELHVERVAGWSEARNALVRSDTAHVHVVMDLSTVLEGDGIGPLLDALTEGVAAAGWRGVHVENGWASFTDSPAGEVEALLSYLIAVRRSAALTVPLPPKARFYRNADMEWSFLLREAGMRLVAVDVPVRQDRHRGYHDSDPELRDRESKKTYDRFLQRFRGREELRLQR